MSASAQRVASRYLQDARVDHYEVEKWLEEAGVKPEIAAPSKTDGQ